MKKVFNILYWVIVLFFANWLVRTYSFIQDIINIFIPLMAVGAVLAIIESNKEDLYIKKTLGLIKSNRTPIYDYIRCIAVILVILFHTLNWDLANAVSMSDTALYKGLDHLRYWALVCNPLFVMLSGALLLGKTEKVGDFYRRRVTKIFIPLVVYYAWYLWEYNEFSGMTFEKLKYLIVSEEHVPHFWLIYYLLLAYITMPILRVVLKNLSYEMLCALMMIVCALSIACEHIGCFEVIGVKIIGWILVSVVGYWCSKEETRRFDYLLIVAGIIATAFMLVTNTSSENFVNISSNLSIYRLLTGAGIFSLMYTLKGVAKDNWFVRVVSKYGYGIMLIHMWALYFVTRRIVNISSIEYHGVGLIVSTVTTLVVSLVMVYIIDNLVVNIFNQLIKK